MTTSPIDIAIPILPSRSLAGTIAFYQKLGFSGEEHHHGGYAILTRGALELHFFAQPELRPPESSAMCYLRVTDVESIHRSFAAAGLPTKGIPRMDSLAVKPWGMNEFAIVDADGNLLRIGQPLA